MRTWILLPILLLIAALNPHAPARGQALNTWDGLPAFDPMHLSGAYAGRQVCPMCTHGYDAGLMLFVPAKTDLAAAASLIGPIRRLREQLSSPRYRVFVILSGAMPSPALVEALSSTHPQWYVASLSGQELQHAERDFGLSLGATPRAFAFAQRRLLRHYEQDDLLGTSDQLLTDAEYAMRLLHWLYPEAPTTAADHDAPQGALWFAPTRLHARLQLADTAAAPACFLDDGGAPLDTALVFFTDADDNSQRPHWARSDEQGCLQVAVKAGRYRVQLLALTQPPLQRELLRVDPARTAPIIGGCDGCEAAFDGRPEHLMSHTRLGAADEVGEAMRLHGKIFAADGTAAAGIQIYAHQTDHHGNYPAIDGIGAAARRHGRLRGWVISDSEGVYRIHGVRPGAYPESGIPRHIHLQVIEGDRCTYYLDDVEFADDALRAGKVEPAAPRGGPGLTQPVEGADGVWEVRRDIHLGRNVPGHQACSSPR